MSSPFERLFAIDTRSLATFRVGLGLLLLADLIYRAQSFEAFHTDAGVLPRSSLALLAHGKLRLWSIHTLCGGPGFMAALFGLQALVAGAVLVGFRTRVALPLAWVLLVSLQHRNPLILTGADQVLRAMLLWACFLPLGAYGSMDSRRKRDAAGRASPWLGIPLLAQIPLLYLFSVIFKLRSDSWTGLHAFAELSRVEGVATDVARTLGAQPELARFLTASALSLELLGPLLAFSPWGTARLRIAIVVAFIAFHGLGIGSSMRLGLMPAVMTVFWLPMLPSLVWESAGRSARSLPRPTQRPRFGVVALGLLLFGVALAENVRSLDLRHAPPPLPLGASLLSDVFALHQRWQLWDRPIANRYYVVTATLPNGSEVDLRTGETLDWSDPARRSRNNQWWKLELHLSAPAGAALREPYVRYLAEAWGDTRPRGERPASGRFLLLDARHPANPATLQRRLLWEGRLRDDTLP
jgi:hypothetical protein